VRGRWKRVSKAFGAANGGPPAEAQELVPGTGHDPIFGPVLLFGAGGVAVEVMDDMAVALPRSTMCSLAT
jgi:acyl-CoA synthetase (NDP forming)